jgi:hypothetical protein
MAPLSLLRVKQVTIDAHIKDAFFTHNQFEAIEQMLVIGQDIIRRTDGSFTVVSRYTVFNRNGKLFLHCRRLTPGLWWRRRTVICRLLPGCHCRLDYSPSAPGMG